MTSPQDSTSASRAPSGHLEVPHLPRRRRKVDLPEEEHGELNLTAMIDMMTILLVFLIKSYSVSAVNITPTNDLQPPRATSPEAVIQSTKITLTKSTVLIDEKPIPLESGGNLRLVPSKDGPAFPAEVVDPKSVYLIPPLLQKLEEGAEKQKKVLLLQQKDLHETLLLVADSDIPFHTISQVLYTAGKVQVERPDGVEDGWFDEYRFVVIVKYE